MNRVRSYWLGRTHEYSILKLYCVRPRSHVPVFARPGDNRSGESTTWSLKHLRS